MRVGNKVAEVQCGVGVEFEKEKEVDVDSWR